MKSFLMVVMLGVIASTAAAQVRRSVPIPPDPEIWVTGSIGLFNGSTVDDGVTNSEWRLGQATTPNIRLAVEESIPGQAHMSYGLAASYVHAPFTYLGNEGNASCFACAAHLDLTSLGVSFHWGGGGPAFHQVFEASAGAVQYTTFTRDSDKSSLAPVGGNIDPYFTFGYGFAYTLSPISEVSVVPEFGLALHERTGLTSDQSNALQMRTIRLNFRYGFGNRIKKAK